MTDKRLSCIIATVEGIWFQTLASMDNFRGYSSAGRALEWHSRGQRFDPAYLHQSSKSKDLGLLFLAYLGTELCKYKTGDDLKMTKKERADIVTGLLKEAYPGAVCALHYTHDYELLFATRLSAQCTDARVNIVTEQLFRQFPTLESFASAPEDKIAEAIKTCGLFRTKARDIKACAVMLLSEYGGKVPDTMEKLLKLPGVGRKTANLILGDIFGKPAIVCDTHCIRLSNRLKLVDNEKDPVKVEKALRKLIDPVESSDFCHRLVLHGRACCTARNPKCSECPLSVACPSYNAL